MLNDALVELVKSRTSTREEALLKSVDNEGAGTEELIRRALQAAAR
mgnify:CR=1 FL=1